jgi:hypothetical protein
LIEIFAGILTLLAEFVSLLFYGDVKTNITAAFGEEITTNEGTGSSTRSISNLVVHLFLSLCPTALALPVAAFAFLGLGAVLRRNVSKPKPAARDNEASTSSGTVTYHLGPRNTNQGQATIIPPREPRPNRRWRWVINIESWQVWDILACL